MRRPRLFLDANVLHAAAVRDLLLRLAGSELVEVRWSGVPESDTAARCAKLAPLTLANTARGEGVTEVVPALVAEVALSGCRRPDSRAAVRVR